MLVAGDKKLGKLSVPGKLYDRPEYVISDKEKI